MVSGCVQSIYFTSLFTHLFGQFILHVGTNRIQFPCVSLGFPHGIGSDSDYFNITGRLVLSIPENACSSITNSDRISGNIVLIDGNDCYTDQKVRRAFDAGALGVVIETYFSFGSSRSILHDIHDDIDLRGVEISSDSVREIRRLFMNRENRDDVYVELIPQENDRHRYASSEFSLFMAVLIGMVNLYLNIFCVYRLVHYFRAKIQLIPIVTYSSICIGGIIRDIWCIDSNGTNLLLPYPVRTVLFSISFPFALTSTLFVAFYWLEIFDRKQIRVMHFGLPRYKIHCAAVLIVIFTMEIITSSLRARLFPMLWLLLTTVALYVIVEFCSLIFYAYNCRNIYIFMRETLQINKNTIRKRTLMRLYILGILQCIGLALFIVLAVMLGSVLNQDPLGDALIGPICQFTVSIFCIFQAWMFKNPIQDRTDDTYPETLQNKNDSLTLQSMPTIQETNSETNLSTIVK